MQSNANKAITIILIGNKKDLEERREISVEEARAFAEQHNIMYIETSARTGEGIETAFIASANATLSKIENSVIDISNESCGVKVGNLS